MTTITVAFVGTEPSDALRDYAISKIGSVLDARVASCRVVIESQTHHHTDARFRAKVELAVDGAPHAFGGTGEVFGDAYAAVDHVRDVVKRALHEHRARATHARRSA
jgi:hypothetical protein